ncbi:patatin-like phospholipase family protein [Aquirufa salirivi]|uniref:Patatin-like phospholipase family protein n=1 Tax=Aquirufa salirivi TaxID=3104729 RepID=A0ABW8RU73_9BACT
MSKILALSGGSVKGAFQAGVIRALFERGYEPDLIYGISAGSLNAAYLVNQLGRQKLNGELLNFPQAGQDLWDFWETRITHPECLSKPLSLWELGWTALTKNFRGLVSTKPLRDLVEGVLDIRNLQASPVEMRIGAVNIMEGGIHYVDPSYDHFYDYLLASSAIPILMPVVRINQEKRRSFLDGGLRDVAPLQKAIKDGGKHIVCISCHTQTIEGGIFEPGDLLALVDRVMDIAVNEILNADLKEALLIQNQRSDLAIYSIRPIQPLSIDIQHFNKLDIRRMLEIGYAMGKAEEYF